VYYSTWHFISHFILIGLAIASKVFAVGHGARLAVPSSTVSHLMLPLLKAMLLFRCC